MLKPQNKIVQCKANQIKKVLKVKRNMRVLVTGGAGFIGSHLVDRLLTNKDYEVTVLDNFENGLQSNVNIKAQTVYGDVSQFNFQTLDGFNIIYHLACHPRSRSFTNPKRDVDVNVKGMVNIIECARRNDAKIVFSSNSGIYDTCSLPINEQTKDNPKTPYDLDKLSAEGYLKLYYHTYGLPYTIFRFATVYGPRQRVTSEWHPVVATFIQQLLCLEVPTIQWDGNQTRDLIYVEDIVDGLTAALDGGNDETMILGTGIETSILTLYRTICNLLGCYTLYRKASKLLGDIARMQYDCDKAAQIIGWKPKTSLEQGILQTINYFRKTINLVEVEA